MTISEHNSNGRSNDSCFDDHVETFFFFVFLMRTIRERNNARGRIYILLKYGCFRAA